MIRSERVNAILARMDRHGFVLNGLQPEGDEIGKATLMWLESLGLADIEQIEEVPPLRWRATRRKR